MSKIYKAEYDNGETEIFSCCDNDEEARHEAEAAEGEHNSLVWSLYELDENYNEIRTVF